MRIEVGKHAGFCRGVKEAVDKTFSITRDFGGEIFTDGELIHNPQTLKLLESRNVRVIDDGDDLSKIKDKTIIIRAHGVTPQRIRKLKTITKDLKNFTCRDVAAVQAIIKKWSNKGYSIIIFGKRAHPEVIGLLGYAKDGYVVYNKEEVKQLPDLDKVLIVSQTTMEQDAFSEICQTVKEKIKTVEIENTICSATELRQNEVKLLANRNDCVLVIGGKKSSNSKRLYEIGSKYTKTFFVESVSDLDQIDFKGIKKLGITAGASTPDWLITEFIDEIQKKNRSFFSKFLRNILNFSLHSNLIGAIGTFLLSLAVADILNVNISLNIGLLVSLFYLSMSLMNSYTNRNSFKIDNPGSYAFVSRFRYAFLSFFIISIMYIIYIAFQLGTDSVILIFFSLLLGAMYNLSFLPLRGVLRKIMFFRKWDLLALKSIVLAFAVTVLLNSLYILNNYSNLWSEFFQTSSFIYRLEFYFSVYFIFVIMFTRQVFFEFKSAQTDKIAGVSSILSIMKKENVIRLLYILPAFLILLIVVEIFRNTYLPSINKYFIVVAYNYLLLSLIMRRQTLHNRSKFEMIIESNLFIAGLISFL